jgi:hypothetical protein
MTSEVGTFIDPRGGGLLYVSSGMAATVVWWRRLRLALRRGVEWRGVSSSRRRLRWWCR